jgi:hypothetical protein
MARKMGMDVGKILLENLIQENGKTIKQMEKESIYGILEINILETGLNF